jgi:hypothetical protein
MVVLYRLWPFGIFFPFWYVWTKKNLAAMIPCKNIIQQSLNRGKGGVEAVTLFSGRRLIAKLCAKLFAAYKSGIMDGEQLGIIKAKRTSKKL